MTIPPKKVNNADSGDADHVGGNDWDDIADYMDNVDKTGPVKINTRTYFRSGKRELRNPADTFSYIETAGAIAADRIVNEPVLTGTDTRVYEAHTQTLTNKTIDQISNPIKQQNAFKYVVFIDTADSNRIKCIDQDTGAIVSNNTSALTTLQYAVDNASGSPILVKRGTYSLTAVLNCVDKHVCIIGEGRIITAGAPNMTVLSRAGHVIDMNNTVTVQDRIHLENLYIDGVDESGTGIRMNDVRQCFDLIHNVHIINCNIGMHFTRGWYDNFYGLAIENCNTGLWIENNGTPSTMQDGGNTLYFYGGKIHNCDTYNINCDVVHDASFFGTIVESDSSSPATYQIKLDAESEQVNFYSCSLETFNASSITVHDEGKNNRFYNCRFQLTGAGDYTAYEAVSAKSCSLIGNVFGAETTGNITITIDSGSSDINLIDNNGRRWVTPLAINLTDNSSNTTRIGNSFCDDRISKKLIHEDYTDNKIISAPGNPSSGYGRMYAKTIDSNNDGLFIKIKKNNAFQEVQIA